jgi:hypothetical protein
MELSEDKTLITHSSKWARLLSAGKRLLCAGIVIAVLSTKSEFYLNEQ